VFAVLSKVFEGSDWIADIIANERKGLQSPPPSPKKKDSKVASSTSVNPLPPAKKRKTSKGGEKKSKQVKVSLPSEEDVVEEEKAAEEDEVEEEKAFVPYAGDKKVEEEKLASPEKEGTEHDKTPDGKVRVNGVIVTPEPLEQGDEKQLKQVSPPPLISREPLRHLHPEGKPITYRGETFLAKEYTQITLPCGVLETHDAVLLTPEDEEDPPDVGVVIGIYRVKEEVTLLHVQNYWRSEHVTIVSAPDSKEVFKSSSYSYLESSKVFGKCEIVFPRNDIDVKDVADGSFFCTREYNASTGTLTKAVCEPEAIN
jgi:hypothetical protein